eukprot:2188782-Rhodomonas_salina.1
MGGREARKGDRGRAGGSSAIYGDSSAVYGGREGEAARNAHGNVGSCEETCRHVLYGHSVSCCRTAMSGTDIASAYARAMRCP